MHRSTDYPTSTRDRRNSSPSSRSSSGFSTPSTTDSSGPTASSSSDTSPPSSSGTPPDAQSKQASRVELVASSSRSANSRGGDNNNNNGTNHYQSTSSSSFTIPRSPTDGDQYHRRPPPTPLYVDVKARNVGDIGGIQNQVEAALYAHSNEQRQWEKTMNYCHEATLRSRLEATSSIQQQQREELVSGDDASINPTLPPPGPLEKDLLLSSSSSSSLSPANTSSSSRSQIGKGQTQPDLQWVNDVMGNGNGRSEGENLIDAVIAHNAAYRLANGASNGSSSNPSRTNARGQPARPPMPIATKQLPYMPSTAYGRTSVESTPRASPIAIPSSRGDGSPISSTRPR